jgi:UDP-N-acetyl-D-mannosaminuronic acid dehydrogenase
MTVQKNNVLGGVRDGEVCVLGLGYVGLTLAVTMADIGFKVVGVEVLDDVVQSLSKGLPHFFEPGLESRLKRVIKSGNLLIKKQIPDQWNGSVYIITVGTPLDENKRVRLDMIKNVSSEVASHMKEDDLVIMRSTLKIGTTRNIVLPILKRECNKFDLAFCSERTSEGKALIELRQLPQIVGGMSEEASVRVSQLFQLITPTVIRVSDVETAEMIKLIDNTQRDVSFAYANEVARACDAIGVSAIEVIRSGGLGYLRTNLPTPGPVGGPCLEKDSYILSEGLSEFGIKLEISEAARMINERQPSESISFLRNLVEDPLRNMVITLMGIAFKGQPETDDLRGSMAKPIFYELKKTFRNSTFRCYDAVVSKTDIVNFGLEPVTEVADAFSDADLVIILNNHKVFYDMDIEALSATMKSNAVIYDFWNCFRSFELHLFNNTRYIALGSHKNISSE